MESDCSQSFRIPPRHRGNSLARVKVCYEAEWDPTSLAASLRKATVWVENIATNDIQVNVLVQFKVSGNAHVLGACPVAAHYQTLKPDEEWSCTPDTHVSFHRPAIVQATADVTISGQRTRTLKTDARRIG
ncbi:hypothetical protein ABZ924_17030 [Streptomyces sp. NPDC046876]|uniref:hypothetical protein n=1 Tax=Streptomyces sp. NPDC046876 TaxID=3155616 RepID=UPI0033F7F18B